MVMIDFGKKRPNNMLYQTVFIYTLASNLTNCLFCDLSVLTFLHHDNIAYQNPSSNVMFNITVLKTTQ